MSREQAVRDAAYAIWEAEGRPSGRDAEHWKQAEEKVAAGHPKDADKGGKGKAAAKATTPAKAAAKSPRPKRSSKTST